MRASAMVRVLQVEAQGYQALRLRNQAWGARSRNVGDVCDVHGYGVLRLLPALLAQKGPSPRRLARRVASAHGPHPTDKRTER